MHSFVSIFNFDIQMWLTKVITSIVHVSLETSAPSHRVYSLNIDMVCNSRFDSKAKAQLNELPMLPAMEPVPLGSLIE